MVDPMSIWPLLKRLHLEGYDDEDLSSLSTNVETSFDTFDTCTGQVTRHVFKFQLPAAASCAAQLWHEPCICSMAEGKMFRISTIDMHNGATHDERRLVVEGTLVHPWVDELRKAWSNAGNSLEGRKLVIDLTNVTVISREGESAIFDLMNEGATFACGGIHTRHLLRELAHRCHAKVKHVLNQKRSKG
jgi:hypothetical protein